jgi:DNA-binding MarR family transcriptional regulator
MPTSQSAKEHAMSDYPPLSTQVIGQAESALGALLEPLLASGGITFHEWLVLAITAASGGNIDRSQLIARISAARKLDAAAIETAIAELAAAGMVVDEGPVEFTDAGRGTYQRIRDALEETTARLFDFPPQDLAAAGRLLGVVTERANALLSAQQGVVAGASRSTR